MVKKTIFIFILLSFLASILSSCQAKEPLYFFKNIDADNHWEEPKYNWDYYYQCFYHKIPFNEESEMNEHDYVRLPLETLKEYKEIVNSLILDRYNLSFQNKSDINNYSVFFKNDLQEMLEKDNYFKSRAEVFIKHRAVTIIKHIYIAPGGYAVKYGDCDYGILVELQYDARPCKDEELFYKAQKIEPGDNTLNLWIRFTLGEGKWVIVNWQEAKYYQGKKYILDFSGTGTENLHQ